MLIMQYRFSVMPAFCILNKNCWFLFRLFPIFEQKQLYSEIFFPLYSKRKVNEQLVNRIHRIQLIQVEYMSLQIIFKFQMNIYIQMKLIQTFYSFIYRIIIGN